MCAESIRSYGGQFGQAVASPCKEVGRKLNRNQVGVGKVAVVVRGLFGPLVLGHPAIIVPATILVRGDAKNVVMIFVPHGYLPIDLKGNRATYGRVVSNVSAVTGCQLDSPSGRTRRA